MTSTLAWSAGPGRLPGLPLSLGLTLAWLGGLVLLPLCALLALALQTDPATWLDTLLEPRTLAACRLSLGSALLSAVIDTSAGLAIAWALTRTQFPLRGFVDAAIDLPLALPTAVAGISLGAVYGSRGVLGGWLESHGMKVIYSQAGIVLAMMLVNLPFAVRPIQAVLRKLDPHAEEAAVSLGGSRWRAFRTVVLPALRPALATAFALTFANSVGEYGSVIFVASNLPGRSEIAPLLIMTRLEEFDYAGAAAIAIFLLAASLAVLITVTTLQARGKLEGSA
ncbi:MAG TPA: sulfate ABC transporter permease subunit CysT [Planctomycetota bacterium]|nr:sulfate ABC transporter permease subunit CysT [Planctomycetota bacterium]